MPNEAQTLLFTFRPNEVAHGEPLAEILVEQLAGYDPAVSGQALRFSWSGTRDALQSTMVTLGFAPFDVTGVLGALGDHRNADRRLETTPEQLKSAGFTQSE